MLVRFQLGLPYFVLKKRPMSLIFLWGLVILFETDILVLNVWFVSISVAVREFERGNIDREGAVEESDGFGATLDGRNSATDNIFLIWACNNGAGVFRK